MLLTEIATSQPHFQSYFGSLRASYYFQGRLSSVSFTFGYEQRFFPAWKHSKQKNVNCNMGYVELQRRALLIKAVTTLEPKPLVSDQNGFMVSHNSGPELPATDLESTKSTELDDREKLRRMRISKANKGNTPWNKGRKHSSETLRRIKERTWLAMQDPKVKMKLANLGHAQSEETRMKIGMGVRMRCERRRKMWLVQETCCLDWRNLIAEAARQGYTGEEELQWNSYKILDLKLRQECLESMEQNKKMPGAPDGRRAPKSPEQRRKIAEAISAKWTDPEYRERVLSSLAKHHGIPPATERKPRRSPSNRKKMKVREVKLFIEKEIKVSQKPPLRKSKAAPYKDPFVDSKLEMIKNIRAQRAPTETKHMEAVERARLLIAEAEKAAAALEVAARKSPVAHASLIETRKLIAHAVQSIRSIEARQVTKPTAPSVSVHDEVIVDENERPADIAFEDEKQSNERQVNGNSVLAFNANNNSLNFGGCALHELLRPTNSNGVSFSTSSCLNGQDAENRLTQPEAGLQPLLNDVGIDSHTDETATKSRRVTKKWVRGRLVVSEEA